MAFTLALTSFRNLRRAKKPATNLPCPKSLRVDEIRKALAIFLAPRIPIGAGLIHAPYDVGGEEEYVREVNLVVEVEMHVDLVSLSQSRRNLPLETASHLRHLSGGNRVC